MANNDHTAHRANNGPTAHTIHDDLTENNTSTDQRKSIRPRPNWSRYLLLFTITIAFFVLNQPFNLASIFVFVMLLLGTPIFEFLYKYIDVLDPLLENGVDWAKSLLLKLLPMVKPSIDAQAYLGSLKDIRKRLGWIYIIVITAVFVGEFLYPATHYFIFSQASSLNDSLCVSSAVNIQLTCGNGLGVDPFSTDDGTISVGLINQGGPFDHSAMNGPEKQVEILIFKENVTACTNPNHITLAIVTMLSRTVDDATLSAQVGLDDLRGAYLAQRDYNSIKGHQTKLCLVIGNIGTRLTTVQTIPLVLQRLVRYMKYDPTFRGVVGFPFSSTAKIATDTLKGWGQAAFPIVSPSATSDLLNTVTNFYRVVSSDLAQSEAMVQFVEQEYQTQQQPTPINIAVFSDSADTYSTSLHDDFVKNVDKDQPNIHTFPESYQIENPASLDAPLEDALQQKANFIFFAGYAYDLDALEDKLQALQGPGASPIPILGGDGLYDLTHSINNPYSIVYSTVYASPIERNDPFAVTYQQLFGPSTVRTTVQAQYSLLPPHAILAYDATTAYLKTIDWLVSRGEDLTQQNVNALLATISFTGKSGSLTFQGNVSSNPLDKPVYILCTDRNRMLHEAAQSVPGERIKFFLQHVTDCT